MAAGAQADRGDLKGALRTMSRATQIPKRVRDHHLRQWYVLGDLHDRAGDHARGRPLVRARRQPRSRLRRRRRPAARPRPLTQLRRRDAASSTTSRQRMVKWGIARQPHCCRARDRRCDHRPRFSRGPHRQLVVDRVAAHPIGPPTRAGHRAGPRLGRRTDPIGALVRWRQPLPRPHHHRPGRGPLMRRVVPVLLALSVIAAACGQKSGVAGTGGESAGGATTVVPPPLTPTTASWHAHDRRRGGLDGPRLRHRRFDHPRRCTSHDGGGRRGAVRAP